MADKQHLIHMFSWQMMPIQKGYHGNKLMFARVCHVQLILADIWDDEDDDDDEEDDHHDGEPDWVASEREQFASYRDKNKDGKLDEAEIKEWIIPEDYDHSSAEATHLMESSDTDKVCWSSYGL